jgi:methionyl-tRNA formyltransferase
VNDKKYKIYKAEPLNDFPFGNNLSPGELVASLHDNSFIVRCRNGFLKVVDFEIIDKA